MSKFIKLTVIAYNGSEITGRKEAFFNAANIVEFQQNAEVSGYHPAYTSIWQADGDERGVAESARWIAAQLDWHKTDEV